MKALIVFYSRTGVTRKVAETLAAGLDADIEEIADHNSWSGKIGFIKAGRAAMSKKLTSIDQPRYSPADYDTIILGAPVWAGKMPPALRTYIRQVPLEGKEIALFATMKGNGGDKIFSDISEEAGLSAFATLAIKADEVQNGSFEAKTEDFSKVIVSHVQ